MQQQQQQQQQYQQQQQQKEHWYIIVIYSIAVLVVSTSISTIRVFTGVCREIFWFDELLIIDFMDWLIQGFSFELKNDSIHSIRSS